jgi:protein SCO1/2
MADTTRRKVLAVSALAPVVGIAGALWADGTSQQQSAASDGPNRFSASLSAREKLRRRFFPNLPLITHEGKKVLFYDDVIKGKIVTINMFYAQCDEICPRVTANLVKVQKLLGDRVGRDIFMYSITLKPEQDTPQAMRDFMEMHGVKPGWTFLTGASDNMEMLRRKLGFTYPDPEIDKDKSQHIGNVRYGNEPMALWAACPGQANAEWIVESISWVDRGRLNPNNTNAKKDVRGS